MNFAAQGELKTVERAIADVIYRACLLLDDQKFTEWLELCAPEFSYRITTYSPEIRRQMTWYEQDVAGLKGMIEMLPKHNTDHGRLTRHVTVYTVIDSGETQLFLIGRYHDRFTLGEQGPRFLERNVMLDTRRLDKGSHYPI